MVVVAWAVARGPGAFEEEASLVQVRAQAADSAAPRGPAGPAGAAAGERRAAAAAGASGAAGRVTVERSVVVEKPVVEVAVEKMVTQESAASRVAAAPASAAAPRLAAIQELAASDRQIIRNGTLVLMVADLEDAIGSIRDLVAGIPGAFFANSEIKPVRDLPAFHCHPAYSGCCVR